MCYSASLTNDFFNNYVNRFNKVLVKELPPVSERAANSACSLFFFFFFFFFCGYLIVYVCLSL